MVKIGIIGYTPFNGHPYSFGCIVNGFDKETRIKEYPQIASYLKENMNYKEGIKDLNCTHIFCKDKERTQNIASTIRAKPIYNILDFPKDLDLILILCDYSKERKSYILKLSENYKLFVDKPLIKNEKDFHIYSKLIKDNKIFSSSMLMHDSQFQFLKTTKNIKEINVIYSGIWEEYFSHAIDPIIKIFSDESSLEVTSYGHNSVLLKKENILINFNKEKLNIPNFEYNFIYKNSNEFKVKIKSNFNSFRNGLIKIRDTILSGKSYRSLNEYKSSLNIYEALKNE